MSKNNNMFSRIISYCSLILNKSIGQITWSSPPWLKSLNAHYKSNPFQFFSVILGVIALMVATYVGYYWYQHRPQPNYVTVNISPPEITPLEKKLKPNPVTLNFVISSATILKQASVAPLSRIGSVVSQGVSLTPAIPGQWRWQNDSQLVFTPSIDWPADQSYTILFEKSFFTKQTKLQQYKYQFSTTPFSIKITKLAFYQDVKDPKVKRVIGSLSFNYPVNPSSLEPRIRLVWQQMKDGKLNLTGNYIPLSIHYDEHKRTAYFYTNTLALPVSPEYIALVVTKGVRPQKGSTSTRQMISQNILIPNAGSFLKITNIDTNIVRDNQDNPQQVVTIETTIGVQNSELLKHLHIYALPKNYPAQGVLPAKLDYKWQDPGEVTPEILKQTTLIAPKEIPPDHDYPTLHSFIVKAQTPGYLYIKIDKGLTGFGNFYLTHDYANISVTPEYPQEIIFLHKGAIIALNSEKKLSLLIRGVPMVKFSVGRVLPDDINHLVTQTYGKFSDPKFYSSTYFDRENISTISSELRNFNISNPGDVQYSSLDLEKYLPTNGKLGLFLLKAQGWDFTENEPTDVDNSRLILVTDMGLIIKDNADSTHDVFVQSITEGAPVAGATVTILGKNGLPIVTKVTDDKGHVNLPSVEDYLNEKSPTVYLVTKGNDVSFMPYHSYDRQLNYSRFDTSGITNPPENNNLTAFLFSDRGVYRPGEKIHVGAIVKQQYIQPLASAIPLEEIITDPRGNNVLDQKVIIPTSGLVAFNYQPDKSAVTGDYTFNLYIIKDDKAGNLLGSTTVRVQEFLPDRLKMTAQFIAANLQQNPKIPGWVSPLGLKAKISLWNLFGTPAASRKVNAKINLVPKALSFSQFPDYLFVDPLIDPKQQPKSFSENLKDTLTNSKGEATFDLNLERFGKSTYQLTFYAEGFEADGGRAVNTQSSVLVTPLNYLIGVKPDSDLNYLKQNSQHVVNLIAINSQLKQIPVNKLHVEFYINQTIATLVKMPDDTYQYQSIVQPKLLQSTPFGIEAKGNDITLPTQNIGDFSIVVKDDKNELLSKLNYSVIGESAKTTEKNAVLAIKLDKNEYNPGDTIQMQIVAPYSGSGLITIERDKVYAYQWFKTNSPNSIQTIQIPADYQGNGYINVAFVRDYNSDEIYINPLSYSVVPFSVSNTKHAMQVNLTLPNEVKPGEVIPIQYQTNQIGKIIIFGADEGILQVADYQTPDPLAYFFQKQALTVVTGQIMDQILPKYIASRELSAVGGDGAERALASNINPFARKTEAPAVFWSGIISADQTAKTINYRVPDYFNGTLRVMAVAVGSDTVGSAGKQVLVRGDFVINPNIPTFVAPGDKFTISVAVSNNIKGSGGNQPTLLELATSSALKILGPSQKQLIIPEGQERVAEFTLQALDNLGSAQLRFTAKQGTINVSRTTSLSVRPGAAYQTRIISGYDKTSSKAINIDYKLYPNYRVLEAFASPNPLVVINGLQGYLNNYPFNCTEQLISKAFAQLAIAKQPLFAANPKLIQNKIDEIVQILRARENSSGGFSYWPNSADDYNGAFSTLYATDFLTEAKAEGYNIPNDLLATAIEYLKDYISDNPENLDEARMQAYAIYLLTRNEIVTTSYLTNLQLYLAQHQTKFWKSDLASAYIAATYKLLQNDKEAENFISGYQLGSEHNYDPSDFYNNLGSDAQYVTLLARHFPAILQKLGVSSLMPLINEIANNEVNTFSAGYAAEALTAYSVALPLTNSGNLSIAERVDNKIESLTSLSNLFQKVNFSPNASQIIFNNPNSMLYFYQIRQTGFNLKPALQAVSNGLEVFRDYRDETGKRITATKLGSEINSHIQIRSLSDQTLYNVAIVDLLPGGFDVVPDSIQQSNCDYVDVREDRVIFYCTVEPQAETLSYRLRAVNAGDYTVPPIYATVMYNEAIQAQGVTGKMNVLK